MMIIVILALYSSGSIVKLHIQWVNVCTSEICGQKNVKQTENVRYWFSLSVLKYLILLNSHDQPQQSYAVWERSSWRDLTLMVFSLSIDNEKCFLIWRPDTDAVVDVCNFGNLTFWLTLILPTY